MALLNQAMAKPKNAESPRRKIRRPTLPPEDVNMNVNEDSDETSDGAKNYHNNNNKAPRSDNEMTVAAGGN